MTNGTPSWPDQGGNVVVINGGVPGQPRIIVAGNNPSIFPDFSTGAPPVVTLGGWSGPPPGPPAGTSLVGPSGPPETPYVMPPIDQDESRSDYVIRCIADLEGQGAEESVAEELCGMYWDAEANPSTRAAPTPNGRKRRRKS